MITQDTINALKALFGDTVSAPPEGTMFIYNFDSPDANAHIHVKEALERSQLFSTVEVEQFDESVIIQVPYEDWKAAQDWQSQATAPSTLIESMLRLKQPNSSCISVPMSEETSELLHGHMGPLNREFEFLMPIKHQMDQIIFSIPQFHTVRNEWQNTRKKTLINH